MVRNTDTRSIFTSNSTILLYYILGLVTPYYGFTIIIAFLGSMISGVMAHKERNFIISEHCNRIFKTIIISFILILIVMGIAFSILNASNIVIPEQVEFNSFEELWNDLFFQDVFPYVITVISCLILISIWYIFRFIIGIFILLSSKPLKYKF